MHFDNQFYIAIIVFACALVWAAVYYWGFASLRRLVNKLAGVPIAPARRLYKRQLHMLGLFFAALVPMAVIFEKDDPVQQRTIAVYSFLAVACLVYAVVRSRKIGLRAALVEVVFMLLSSLAVFTIYMTLLYLVAFIIAIYFALHISIYGNVNTGMHQTFGSGIFDSCGREVTDMGGGRYRAFDGREYTTASGGGFQEVDGMGVAKGPVRSTID